MAGLIGEAKLYDPAEIADHMRKRTPVGLKHLEIVRRYLEAKGLGALSDDEVIRWFEENVKWKLGCFGLGWVSGFRPDYEEATHVCAPYVKKLSLDEAAEAGFEVDDLYADRATREGLLKSLKIHDPDFLTLNGHGAESVFVGQGGKVVLAVGDTEAAGLLAGRVLNFLSCLVGRQLLPWLVKQGVAACSGYRDVYWFLYGDGVEKYFFEPHFTFDAELYKGASVGEAGRAVGEAYSKALKGAPEGAKPYIKHDADNYAVFGDGDARIREVFIWSYSLDGMRTWTRMGWSPGPEYVWDTAAVPPGNYDDCYVKVRYGDLEDANDEPFRLVKGGRRLVLLEPKGGETYHIGDKVKLRAKILESK